MTFADRDGQIIHIDEAANGLACGCRCPGCGEWLVAKQGAKTIHHFAHQGGTDCKGGLQTALHLAAKAILSEERHMRLPALEAVEIAKDGLGRAHEGRRSIASKTVAFDRVFEEKRFGGLIPDILAEIDGRTLLVEIAVHHFVDQAKLVKIKEAGVACVEVDLSGMGEGWSWASLKQSLLDSFESKMWLTNPREPALKAAARLDAEKLAEQADIEDLNLKTEIERSRARRRLEVPNFNAQLERFEDFRRPAIWARETQRLADMGSQEPAWASASKTLGIRYESPPTYIGIEVPGESAFLVDRRVWQASLFAFFVKDGKTKSFSGSAAVKWCQSSFPLQREFFILQKHQDLLNPGQADELPWSGKAVRHYLGKLVEAGFLSKSGDRFEILASVPGAQRHAHTVL